MFDLVATPQIYWLALAMALLSTVIPVSFEMAALRRLRRNTFSILLSLEPVFAALIGWVFLGQTFGGWRGLAIVLVVGVAIGMHSSTARVACQMDKARTAR